MNGMNQNTPGQPGVRWMREAQTRNGKMMAALAVAQNVANLAGQVLGISVQVYYDGSGTVGTIRWMADFPDLGTYERSLKRLLANQAYQSVVDDPAVSGLFIDGTTRDSLLLVAPGGPNA
jgi:hypothetical protein